MIKILFKKKDLLQIILTAVVCALFMIFLNLNLNEKQDFSLEEAFILARDTFNIVGAKRFSFTVIIASFNLLLFIPMINRIFSDDFEIAKNYIFVRINSNATWYYLKVFQAFVYCLIATTAYNLYIFTFVYLFGFRTSNIKTALNYLLFAIVSGFLILFMVVIINCILIPVVKPHISSTVSVGAVVIMMGLTPFITIPQYFPFTHDFFSWHLVMNNPEFCSYSTPTYYIAITIFIICEIFAGKKVIEKADCL